MRTTDKLKLAWPALLKLAEKGSVSIYYRGIMESEVKLYELRINGNPPNGLLTEARLLDWLIKEEK